MSTPPYRNTQKTRSRERVALRFSFRDFLGSADLFDPFAAVQADHAPDGFQYLVDLQEEIDPEGGQVQDQAGQDAEGQRRDPKEHVVGDHQDLGITATAQDTFGHDTVGGLEQHDDGDRAHQLSGDVGGLR